jgi:hypothetical protein
MLEGRDDDTRATRPAPVPIESQLTIEEDLHARDRNARALAGHEERCP